MNYSPQRNLNQPSQLGSGELNEYFIVKLPTVPGFKGKNGIQNTEKYQRIRKALVNSSAKVFMSLLINAAQNFKEFVASLQSAETKIHILHGKCKKLITGLVLHFVNRTKMYNNKGVLLCNYELLELIEDKQNHKVSFLWNIKI